MGWGNLPYRAARWRGSEASRVFVASGAAFESSRSSMHLLSPEKAAQCSGDEPAQSSTAVSSAFSRASASKSGITFERIFSSCSETARLSPREAACQKVTCTSTGARLQAVAGLRGCRRHRRRRRPMRELRGGRGEGGGAEQPLPERSSEARQMAS